MSAGSLVRVDGAVATGATLLAGAGTVVALAGAAAGDVTLLLVGAAAALSGLVVLLAAEWVDRLALLAVALPLPALFSTDALRLSPAAAATALVLFAWALSRGIDPRQLRLGALPRLAAVVFLAALAVAASFAEYKLPAAREVTTFILLLGLLAMATDELGARPGAPARLARLIAAVGGATGGMAVLQAARVIPGEYPLWDTPFYRANLGFGGPTELAMFLAISLPFTIFAWQTARSGPGRALASLWVATTVAGLAATFSRGSWLAVVAATVVLLPLGRYRLAGRIWAGALVAGVLLGLASGGVILDRLLALATGDWVVEQRAAFMLAGLLMFLEQPLVGVGPGGFGAHLERFGLQVDWLWDTGTSAHNTYLHMAAETGLIGLGALLLLFAGILLALLRATRAAQEDPASSREELQFRTTLLWAFGVACAVSMVEWSFAHGIGQLIMLVAAMGLAAGVRRPT